MSKLLSKEQQCFSSTGIALALKLGVTIMLDSRMFAKRWAHDDGGMLHLIGEEAELARESEVLVTSAQKMGLEVEGESRCRDGVAQATRTKR